MEQVRQNTIDLTGLSDGAIMTLKALLLASSGNGHDFGFMDEAYGELDPNQINKPAFAAYVRTLERFIEWRDNLNNNGARSTVTEGIQFGLTEETIEAETYIYAQAAALNCQGNEAVKLPGKIEEAAQRIKKQVGETYGPADLTYIQHKAEEIQELAQELGKLCNAKWRVDY